MAKASITQTKRVRYEEDLYAWSQKQAALLRARIRWPDWEHPAEEIAAEAQPALRGASWRKTLRTQRREIRNLPKQSPTLRRHVPALIRDAYGDAVEDAVDETGLPAQNSERLSVHAGAVLDEENLPDATF
jgi:hypothetical protein